jgi:hypothetical protein
MTECPQLDPEFRTLNHHGSLDVLEQDHDPPWRSKVADRLAKRIIPSG